MDLSQNALTIRDLRVALGTSETQVLRGIDLALPVGHSLGIVGESGSGKSTVLRTITRLFPHGLKVRSSGSIEFGGRDLLALPESQMRKVRADQIGFVFQEPLSALNPGFRIGWQLEESARYVNKDRRLDTTIQGVVESVGLSFKSRLLRAYPFELSGGMRQRVLLAMTLLRRPKLLLADEPTTALDVLIAAEVLDLINQLKEQYELSVVHVSHDLATIARHSDRVAVMYQGEIVEQGPTSAVLSQPAHPYTIGLLAATVDVFGPRPTSLAGIPGEIGDVATSACAFAPRCEYAIEKCWVERPVLESPGWGPVTRRAACHRSNDMKPGAEPRGDAGAASASTITIARHNHPMAVELSAVTVRYPLPPEKRSSKDGSFAAVVDVSLSVERGEIVALVGESGSGKSTLARAAAGLQRFEAGQICIDGHKLTSGRISAETDIRRSVQFIFQDPGGSLNPRMSIASNLARALRLRNVTSRAEVAQEVADLLVSVGLSPAIAGRYPSELSGGQRQRVAIARALAPEPAVIIADEPTSSLDVSIQAQILEVLRDLVHERSLSMLLVTHDFAVVRAVADRAAVMHLGEIVEIGEVGTLVSSPEHPYTRALIEAVSGGEDRGSRARPLAPPLSPETPPTGCRYHPRCPWQTEACRETDQTLGKWAAEHSVRCMLVPLPAASTSASNFVAMSE